MLVSIVAVLATLAGGFAVVNIASGGQSGAGSPEAAVEEFFTSVSNQDLIGVLEVLEPGERDFLVPFMQDLESDLSRLGITEPVDLSNLPGFDLEVRDLEVEATELQPGMSEVQITGGEVDYETFPDDVPIGSVLEGIIEANDGEVDISRERGTEPLVVDDGYDDGLRGLVAMETNGRWHVSLGFTLAEWIRQDDYEPQDLPSLDGGVTPQGASSPEEAVHELAAAVSELDLRRMVALLPPDTMRAVQVYAPLFLRDAQAELDESVAEEGFEVDLQITDMETSSVDGGTRVMPTGFDVSFSNYEEGNLDASYDGDCLEVAGDMADDFEDEFGDTTICWDDVDEQIESELSSEERAELDELLALMEDFEPGIVVVEVDGEHYVDPLRTFGDLVLQTFAGVERSDLEEGGILYRLFTGELSLFDDVFEDGYSYDYGSDDYDYGSDDYDYGSDDFSSTDDDELGTGDTTWEDNMGLPSPGDDWYEDYWAYDTEFCVPEGLSIEDCVDEFLAEFGDDYEDT